MAGRDAAWLGQRLAAAGHDLPLTDLVLSAVALRREYAVYSTDPHFDVVPDLKRFRPDQQS
jgi:predicted nucleic acid-binding protein